MFTTKVVILAGGLGTRMGAETANIPKPMIEIGGKPILWHIMKTYSHYGFNEFIICLGYKGKIIKEYFLDYAAMQYDCTIHLGSQDQIIHQMNEERDWEVTLVDTGENTQTGGRIKRVKSYVGNNKFLATYGDGVADIDLRKLTIQHNSRLDIEATLTGIYNKSKFGEVETSSGFVTSFEEKSNTTMINGGFFVFEPTVFDKIAGDDEALETGLLKRLSQSRQLGLYEHTGFWGCMDSPKEVAALNALWNSGTPPWKVWR